MVPDWTEFEADLRFLPSMDARDILKQINKVFRQAKVRFRIQVDDIQQPYEIDSRHPLVRCLKKAGRDFGKKCQPRGSEGATVITFFKKHNIAAVATGYGHAGCAHATDEYAGVEDLYRGALVAQRFVRLFDRQR